MSMRVFSASLVLLTASASAHAVDYEWNGYFQNETSIFTQDGQTIGQARSLSDGEGHDAGDLLKFENSFRAFINAYVGEESVIHADLNLIYDSEGVEDYKGHENNSQHDYLRELYLDTTAADWLLRLGKQQVVWGTADGIKLLDIINPTDYREFVQNTMEDSRIPVWMINAERDIGDSGNIQLIVSESQENRFPGLNDSGDYGHPFLVKGVDSITGPVNGFRSILPAMGGVSGVFDLAAMDFDGNGMLDPLVDAQGNPTGFAGALGLTAFTLDPNTGQPGPGAANPSVQDFVDNRPNAGAFAPACQFLTSDPTAGTSAGCLNLFANSRDVAFAFTGGNAQLSNDYVTNVLDSNRNDPLDSDYFNSANPNSAFEYFPEAKFATFDSFVKAETRYEVDEPDDPVDLGFRYRAFTEGGTNFSLNYYYAYDKNPAVNLHWETPNGRKLDTEIDGSGVVRLRDNGNASNPYPCALSTTAMRLDTANDGIPDGADNGTPIPLGDVLDAHDGCTLVFTEDRERIHNIGASFDTNLDFESLPPVVIRGEFLYQQDVRVPVIDRSRLLVGDLAGGLKSEETDYFKYVLGVDVTVWTNLLVSTQLIQFYNLDYVEERRDVPNGSGDSAERYTGDPSTLHLSNGLQKGDELETFVSLFFSKPFGEAQRGRFNNITIAENGGGWWNRLQLEYSFSDTFQGLFELNNYWGDDETQFGQLEKSSNLQIGFKYLFE